MRTAASALPVGGARLRLAAGTAPLPRAMLLAWASLFLNVMAFNLVGTVLPIPGVVGQLLTQGALAAAAAFALINNPKAILRPQVALVLLTFLVVQALMVSIHNEFVLGSTFRGTRFLVFVCVLWLLSPWFGRRDMALLRCHLWCLVWVLASVVLGAIVSPGLAFSYGGRLSGVLWPIPPTQVAHYAAVVLGTTVLLWACKVISGRWALMGSAVTVGLLLGTHTRTALVALVGGLLVAGASLFLGNSRVRRATLWTTILVVSCLGLFANELKTWALRGQSNKDVTELTGRTDVWSAVIHTPRPFLNDLFGSGMSNLSFNGLPIDSNWVGTYLDMGVAGVLLDAVLLISLLIITVTRERSPQRAIALFLVVYCIFASITETGMSTRRRISWIWPWPRVWSCPGGAAAMKVLLAHSRYRTSAPSGENLVVDQESAALAEAGHDVAVFERRSDDIGSWPVWRRAAVPARITRNGRVRADLRDVLDDKQPDVLHVHNTFPLLSPSALLAAETPASRSWRPSTTTSCCAPAATSSGTARSVTTVRTDGCCLG